MSLGLIIKINSPNKTTVLFDPRVVLARELHCNLSYRSKCQGGLISRWVFKERTYLSASVVVIFVFDFIQHSCYDEQSEETTETNKQRYLENMSNNGTLRISQTKVPWEYVKQRYLENTSNKGTLRIRQTKVP